MCKLLLAGLMACSAIAAANTPATPSGADRDVQALSTLVPRWLAEARIPGAAIAHVRDGRIESVQVFGERAPGQPLTADAQFNVASLTKPVFALLALHLVADQKLTLDTRLAEHWVDPDIADDSRRWSLTPRLTLSHQSGMPNWRREKLAFDFAPGSRHEYSGEGYEYARRAIERMTGRSMSELMRSYVLGKAGMTHSYFGWNAAIAARLVTGYDEAAKPLDMTEVQDSQANAAAHLFTTVTDYARFALWVAEGADLPKSLLTEMSRSQAQHADPAEFFGLGWRLVRLGEQTVLSHDGRERGVRTQVFVLPASREALVMLTNSNNGELLVQPVATAILGNGAALMRQVSLDIWRFLAHVPAEHIQPMMQGITRSPSFMSKLLYAVDATLLGDSALSASDKQNAHSAIDPFVLGMVQGSVDQPAAQAVFTLLLQTDASGTRLRKSFTAAEAKAWVAALQEAVDDKSS